VIFILEPEDSKLRCMRVTGLMHPGKFVHFGDI